MTIITMLLEKQKYVHVQEWRESSGSASYVILSSFNFLFTCATATKQRHSKPGSIVKQAIIM